MADELKCLDLCCGQGGASLGYFRAGFRGVIGVDIDGKALRRYPFPPWCSDWREGLDKWASDADLIHASPPCQHYSQAVRNDRKASHPDLIREMREALQLTGKPYVIENVPGAPLIDPIELCGCMFDMHIVHRGIDFGLYRKRLFESSFPLLAPGHSKHARPACPVFGEGSPGWFYRKYGFGIPAAKAAELMDTPWMTKLATSESIPPIFTEFVGLQARAQILRQAERDLDEMNWQKADYTEAA